MVPPWACMMRRLMASAGDRQVSREDGLRSFGTGRIEQLYAGGRLEAPAGTLDLPRHSGSRGDEWLPPVPEAAPGWKHRVLLGSAQMSLRRRSP